MTASLSSEQLEILRRIDGCTLANAIAHIQTPSEVDHYQLPPTVDIHVMPKGEALNKIYAAARRRDGGPQGEVRQTPPWGAPSNSGAGLRFSG